MPVTRDPVRTSTPSRSSCSRARCDSLGTKAPSTRSAPSSRITRACAESMRRNSRRRVCRAISLIVPAISTPVGPPPMTTKVIQAARRGVVAGALGALEGADHAGANVEGVGQRLQARREAGPVVVAEVAVRGAGGDDEVIPGDLLAAVERRGSRGHVEALHLGLEDRQVAALHLGQQHVADRCAHRRRAQARRRHLIEQRLEQVMVGAVDQGDLDLGLRQRPHRLDAAEAAADDEHARSRRHGRRSRSLRMPRILRRGGAEAILRRLCDSCSSKTTA